LLDGYFDHRPAVRHKEILWLLGRGARIYGAASMGALRAAEMDQLGMIGIGAIYRAYARGSLTGDDEVALIHALGDHGWRALSVPLVNVRATLCRALRLQVLRPSEARDVHLSAKSMHYSDRCWTSVLAALPSGRLAGFRTWVRDGSVDQKRSDALSCVRSALFDIVERPSPTPAPVRTAYLDALATECGVLL
jgi:hypothetical protein